MNIDGTKLVNFKIYSYQNSQEIRIYKKPILKNVIKESKREPIRWVDGVNLETGEIRSVSSVLHSQQTSLNRSKEKIFELAKSNNWDWFFTFTFDCKKVDRLDYSSCQKVITKWLSNVKHSGKAPDLKYLIVPEQHKKGGWHFHGVLSGIGHLEKDMVLFKNGIYNLTSFKLGFTTATKVQDTKKVSTYITKYITKELINMTTGKSRYLHSKNLNTPVVTEKFLTKKELDKIFKKSVQNSNHIKSVDIERIDQNITYIHIDKNNS